MFGYEDELQYEIKSLKEELETIQGYLDLLNIPRINSEGWKYTLIGRITELGMNYSKLSLKQLEEKNFEFRDVQTGQIYSAHDVRCDYRIEAIFRNIDDNLACE
jgi:hypothetical protein